MESQRASQEKASLLAGSAFTDIADVAPHNAAIVAAGQGLSPRGTVAYIP